MAVLAGLAILTTNAAAQAYEGKVKNGKADEPALIMVYNYAPIIVENALIAKFADKQLSSENNKNGFIFYPNAVVTEISKSKLDYYFKIEPSENKEKTTVYLFMQGAGDIEGAGQLGSRAKSFLENMATDVKRSDDIASIRKQESALVQEEETLAELQKIQKDLEEKLDANRAKLEAQQKIIDSKKAVLDELKSKI